MRRGAAALALLAWALLGAAACSPEEGDRAALDRGEPAAPRLPPIPYTVSFPADLPPELASLLPQVSTAERERGAPPDTRLGIRQRAERDVPLLQQALRSEGYFDGRVGFELADAAEVPAQGVVEQAERALERPQAALVFSVAPGPRYRFGALAVELSDNPDGYPAPTPAALGLEAGAPARTQPVLDAEAALLRGAREAGFALAATGEQEAVVDHGARTMDVTLRLAPGRRASFGAVAFTGNQGIDPAFLRGRLPFEHGQRFDPKLVDEGRTSLFDTDLFSTIVIRPADRLTPGGELDSTVELRQRPPRSIGFTLGYQTDLGPNATAFWEHRNWFGAGERFRVQADASPVLQSATVSLLKPDFLAPKQDLVTDATVRREDQDAYKAESAGAGVALQRELTEDLTGSLGVAFRYARIEETDEPEQNFALLSLPGRLDWDFSNDLLNPTEGGRFLVNAAPFVDLLDTSTRFFKARFTHTRYFTLADDPKLVLALRGSAGSIFGASRDSIPADERFYTGGGGSVRGIAYNLAGPLDDEDDPIGGRSVAEGSVEVRFPIWNDLGGVLFLDGGTVFDSTLPTGGERVLFGAGPGLRYYTPIGPVRLDVGFPLNPRDGVDDGFQLYISIGQAF